MGEVLIMVISLVHMVCEPHTWLNYWAGCGLSLTLG